MELGRRGISKNTTALPRHGILKYIHYQLTVSEGSGGAWEYIPDTF